MKNFISKIVANVCELIFQEKMSPAAWLFFKNLGYIVIGFGIAAIFGFFFQIVAGRVFGPAEYGKYILVQSIAMFLYIPMVSGITTAMMKYNAEKEDYERQRKIISTSYLMILSLSLISVLFFFFFSNQISNIFGISSVLFYLAIIFAFLYGLYILSTSVLRSLHEMKKLSIFQTIYGVLMLTLLLIFIFNKFISFEAAVFATYIVYFLIFFLITIDIRKYLSFHLDGFWLNKLSKYSIYVVISMVSAAFYLNFDKIILNKYLTVDDVGIYGAYYVSFITFALVFFNLFNTVFFPTVSKFPSKKNMFKKVNRIVPYLIIFGLPIMIFFGFFILKLYGSNYPFDLKLGLLFGIGGIIIFLDSIYAWLMAAVSRDGVKVSAFAAIILAVAIVILDILLIPIFGLTGAIIAIIISYTISISIILSKRKYYEIVETIS